MTDLGDASSYLALEAGAPVFTCDGEQIGEVEQVLADDGEDIFDGLVVSGPDRPRYVAGEQVEEIFDRGVLLKLDAAAAGELPLPPS
jgi:sporulation protein YlmC with PRC-barrel domain